MTVIRNVKTSFKNPASLDGFGRQRMSEPFTLLDSKNIGNNLTFIYDDQEVSGSGTSSTYNQNGAAQYLAVSATTAGRRVRQSFQSFNYQSGKSQLINITFAMGSQDSGVKKCVGYYNDENGIFLRDNGTGYEFVIRSNVTGTPVETVIPQASWNVDPLDGTGPSGLTIDFSKTQIFVFDFQWLGVGRVRFGFAIEGQEIIVHNQDHANGLDVVYMSTPNLPIRYEIENDGTGPVSQLECLCASVMSEGGQQQTGSTVYQWAFETDRDFSGADVWKPLISYRKKSTAGNVVVKPSKLSVMCVSNADIQYALVIRPIIAGTDAASWVSVSDSVLEYDISRDNTNNVIGGKFIYGGVLETGNGSTAIPLDTVYSLGESIDGTRDEIVLAVMTSNATTETYRGGVTFIEYL